MKQITYLIVNTVTLVVVLLVNYLSGTGAINGQSVGEVSAQYESLFTPAGYAFGIWGPIYLLLIAFVGYQWYAWLKRKDDHELKKTGVWFALSNLVNSAWIYAWLHEYIGISVLLTSLLLVLLIVLMFRLRLETWDAPLRTIVFVWWPICIYLGWIIVATVANYAIFFIFLGWNKGVMSEEQWTIIMLVASAIIYLLLIVYRNMREAALVGTWAFVAIALKQWQANDFVAWTALIVAIILFLAVSYHGYKNKDTSPFVKLKQR